MPALKRSRDPSVVCEVEMKLALKKSRGYVIQYAQSGYAGCLGSEVWDRVFIDELREHLS